MVPFTTLCLLLLFATYYASGLKPTETTLTLTKDSADPDSLGIGMKSTLTLIAAFSEPTTGGVIELLPSVNETVLAIGKIVSVTKGNELVISEANWDTVSLHPGTEYSASVSLSFFLCRLFNVPFPILKHFDHGTELIF